MIVIFKPNELNDRNRPKGHERIQALQAADLALIQTTPGHFRCIKDREAGVAGLRRNFKMTSLIKSLNITYGEDSEEHD